MDEEIGFFFCPHKHFVKKKKKHSELLGFRKLCTGLLGLRNVLLWYEVVKKHEILHKNNKHCNAYSVFLATANRFFFSFSLLTRSNTGFQKKKKKRKTLLKWYILLQRRKDTSTPGSLIVSK